MASVTHGLLRVVNGRWFGLVWNWMDDQDDEDDDGNKMRKTMGKGERNVEFSVCVLRRGGGIYWPNSCPIICIPTRR